MTEQAIPSKEVEAYLRYRLHANLRRSFSVGSERSWGPAGRESVSSAADASLFEARREESSTANRKESKFSACKIIGQMKPSYCDFESAWSIDGVHEFLQGHTEAQNKETYLKSFKRRKKPSIVNQIKSYSVQFPNNEGIQYKGGTGGEEGVPWMDSQM